MKRKALCTGVMLGLCLCMLSMAEATDGEALYAPILEAYTEGLLGNEALWEDDTLNFSVRQATYYTGLDPLETVGFLCRDLDGDGQEELLIGESGMMSAEGYLFDVWTLRDGVPCLALRGWERNRIYLMQTESGYGFYNEGANGASESIYARGQWENGNVVFPQKLVVNSEKETVWTLNGQTIRSSQVQEMCSAWQEAVIYPPLMLLYDWWENRQQEAPKAVAPEKEDGIFRLSSLVPQLGGLVDVSVSEMQEHTVDAAGYVYTLKAEIQSRDHTFSQTLTYESRETPRMDEAASMARLYDINQDGFRDLVLSVRADASNLHESFCLWNPDKGAFDPVMKCAGWNGGPTEGQLELADLSLTVTGEGEPVLISYEEYGATHAETVFYLWEKRQPVPVAAYTVDTPDEKTVRESLLLMKPSQMTLWDNTYASDWYYGDTAPFLKREEGIKRLVLNAPTYRKVAGVDWVHLRALDSKQSASLAHLNRGTQVQVLAEDCADGWIMVWWKKPDSDTGQTGYIWHRYLQ